MTDILRPALKEWAVAVQALEQGETILLLRKGGIKEPTRTFKVLHDQVWLYPTYEHQQPHLLKPTYTHLVEPVASGWHPQTVFLKAWAQITHVFPVNTGSSITALLPFHIWNAEFVSERLGWKPNSSTYVLLLRTYRLATARTIPYQPEYGGCKSWIELAEPISNQPSEPVLSNEEYDRQVAQIQALLTEQANYPPDPKSLT